jgi:tetratricopeptide (TPR) repeat protein
LVFITFFVGQPFPQLDKFTLNGIKSSLLKNTTYNPQPTTNSPTPHAGEFGGTDSSKIRLLVWQGAIDAWRHYPIFGTGVETYSSAYYRFRPAAHNLSSEWNFLYNKAHNEFLNYLATTGAVGLGSYLLMICYFLFLAIKKISKSEFLISNQVPNPKSELGQLEIRSIRNLTLALLAGYLSILVTNFFGFSVVITNIYLFMIPAFVFILGGMINLKRQFVFPKTESGIITKPSTNLVRGKLSLYQWAFIFFIILVSCFLLLNLFKFWNADKAYALGYNLDRAGEYQQAYPYLQKALDLRAGEPVFKDELTINNAILAGALLTQEEAKTSTNTATLANKLRENAIALSNLITSKHQNNVVFWKSRVRVFYSLSQVDSRYLTFALEAIKKAEGLAPTDASISYNLGVLYGQNGDVKNGIETLEKTIKLKPDYRDAYFALGLFYHDQAVDEKGNVIDRDKLNKAIKHLQYILDNLGAEDKVAKETLEQWKKL